MFNYANRAQINIVNKLDWDGISGVQHALASKLIKFPLILQDNFPLIYMLSHSQYSIGHKARVTFVIANPISSNTNEFGIL